MITANGVIISVIGRREKERLHKFKNGHGMVEGDARRGEIIEEEVQL